MVTLPDVDQEVLANRRRIVDDLARILSPGALIADEEALKAYECDGLMAIRQLPMIVALPESTEQVAAILGYCHKRGVRVVPRGAGTGLSGGALPLADAVTLGLTRMNRILDIDAANRCAVVQPGVTNLAISQAVADLGLYYAPDPSSQIACSIGGNVAENSGGVHCLKYGVTANNLLGVELVLMSGERIRVGGRQSEAAGYDLLGVLTGSEGLLGVVTEVTVRLLPIPETARAALAGFSDNMAAGRFVAGVIAAGIIPGGMEMMDRPAIHAAEAFAQAGYPLDVESLVIIELDGPRAEVDELMEAVEAIARQNGAVSFRSSDSEEERLRFWAGRKAAFPAIGRLSPDYLCMDGTIPRGRLPEVLDRMAGMSEQFGLGVANVFHAGDGNLHPLIMFDANTPDELHKAEQFGAEILRLCVEVGGVLSGEHGIGVEKRDLMTEAFGPDDLEQQHRVKCAFDGDNLLNPGKMFPTLKGCGELNSLDARKLEERFPDFARF